METWNDPIGAEGRAAREAYAEEMQHNLPAICADLRRRQGLHVERVTAFAPRPLPDKQQAASKNLGKRVRYANG